MKTKICAACAGPFTRAEAEPSYSWSRRKCCSKKCAHWMSGKARLGGLPEKTCVCGVVFGRKMRPNGRHEAWVEFATRRSCSPECGQLSRHIAEGNSEETIVRAPTKERARREELFRLHCETWRALCGSDIKPHLTSRRPTRGEM